MIRLNHRALLTRAARHAPACRPALHGDALVALDKLDKIGLDGVDDGARGARHRRRRRREGAARFFVGGVAGDARRRRWIGSATCSATRRRSRTCGRSSHLTRRRRAPHGRIRVDPSLARGLSYYTGAIMEIAVPDLAGSLGGGGRYDNLVGMFLGATIPACGFSLGLERILVVMSEREHVPGDGRRARPPTCMVTLLRRRPRGATRCGSRPSCAAAGLRVEVYPGRRAGSSASSSSTLDAAACRCVAILGDDERSPRRGDDQGPADAAAATVARATARRALDIASAATAGSVDLDAMTRTRSATWHAPTPAARCAPPTSARTSCCSAGCTASAISAALLFLDIRDRHGITQVVVRDDDALLADAKRLRPEFVVGVLGRVERRSPETVNPKLATGEIEVAGARDPRC